MDSKNTIFNLSYCIIYYRTECIMYWSLSYFYCRTFFSKIFCNLLLLTKLNNNKSKNYFKKIHKYSTSILKMAPDFMIAINVAPKKDYVTILNVGQDFDHRFVLFLVENAN